MKHVLADLMPASGWINIADIDRMASAAAERTAALIAKDALKPGHVETWSSGGIKRFLDKVGTTTCRRSGRT